MSADNKVSRSVQKLKEQKSKDEKNNGSDEEKSSKNEKTAVRSKSGKSAKPKKPRKKKSEKIHYFLLDPLTIESKWIGYSDPEPTEMVGKDGKTIKFFRIPSYLNLPKGYVIADIFNPEKKTILQAETKAHLIFDMGSLFSFGVNENTDTKSGELNGYSMPFALYAYKGPTERQKAVVQKLEEIVNHGKEYMVSVRAKIREHQLELSDLKKFSPIKWPKDEETGEIIPDKGPTIYGKALWFGDKMDQDDEGNNVYVPAKMSTNFYRVPVKRPIPENGLFEFDFESEEFKNNELEKIDFTELIGSYCYTRPALHFTGLFSGSLAKSYQVKLRDVIVDPLPKQQGAMTMFHKKTRTDRVVKGADAISALMGGKNEKVEISSSSIEENNQNEDMEEEEDLIEEDEEEFPSIGKGAVSK